MFLSVLYKFGPISFPFCQGSRMWETHRQTDGRTDTILIAIPRLHYMQRGNYRCVNDRYFGYIIFIRPNLRDEFLPRCMKCRRGIAMRIQSVRLSFCLSVCLSHAWSLTKWKKDRSRFLYHTKHLSYFSEKKNGWWRATNCTWNFGSTDPRWSEIADFQPIIARSSSAVTASEKGLINANRNSNTRFLISLRLSL